jgi:pyruvate dehydrogenase E1 component
LFYTKVYLMRDNDTTQDQDPIETQEWLEAIATVVQEEGVLRARELVQKIAISVGATPQDIGLSTDYINTISADDDFDYPGDLALEEAITSHIRWNAAAMVMKARRDHDGIGGHIASYASIANLYEVGYQHFFRHNDLVYFQGHSAEGNYARAFMEGRLTEEQLNHFRREIDGKGISSYPHPWLMPDFWQFPTVSLGLGGLQAVYAARFLKYLENRQLQKTADRKVWLFCGDGEMDEADSGAGITLAAREKLDNLIMVINCNLQRLDGLVRGNHSIVKELESLFRGAGWHVIKVLWSSDWDALFARDTSGKLIQRMNECVDGDFQDYRSKDGAYFREHFFGKYPELLALVSSYSDEDLLRLRCGGHDPIKIYSAYAQAVKHTGQPVVILAQSVKGYGMGTACESQNIAHNQTGMNLEQLESFRQRFNLSMTDEQLARYDFYKPPESSDEMQYLHVRREALGGGYHPHRRSDCEVLSAPPLSFFDKMLVSTGERELSTTMVLARIYTALLKDKTIGARVVPIFSDEARTFGMENLFRQVGIYSPDGQQYTPEDKKQLMYYKEALNGQVLQEGITEAGCMASWIAAATSYSANQLPMIPFFTYYSMFGFQRVFDYIWAAGDARARGFLMGGTAGRTTLAGEGLQHQDGHSLLIASTMPSCRAYDPAYGFELAVIVQYGLDRMLTQQKDEIFYVMVMNEKYSHPEMPQGAEAGIIQGMYCLISCDNPKKHHVQLMGGGAILREVEAAATLLLNDFNISADVWSLTSVNELRREALHLQRENQLHPKDKKQKTYIEKQLENTRGPVIAATDYMKAYAEQIREFVPRSFTVLGTDGYGRSDTRQKLREFFEVDRFRIAYTAIVALVEEGQLDAEVALGAMKKYGIDPNKPNPVTV